MTAPKAPQDWLAANQANWDRRVELHLDTPEYSLEPLRACNAALSPIERAELPNVKGKKVLHLQCHFGRDTLVFAQDGAQVVGVDFSGAAIEQARKIASELGYEAQSEFHQCNLFDAPDVVPGAGSFDLVFTSWGTIGWLPDIDKWARVAAHFVKPGGQFYFADAHPFPLVLDDETPEQDGRPGWFLSYFGDDVFVDENPVDYAGNRKPVAGKNYAWMHPMSSVLGALQDAGLVLDTLSEHDSLPWQMFSQLVKGKDGMYRWAGTRWFPLSWSLRMHKPSDVP